MALRGQFAISDEVERYYLSWSECMQEEGYSFVSPLDALVSFQQRLPSGDVDFEDQRQVAMATVRCGGSVLDFLPDDLRQPWAEFVAVYLP